MGDMPVIDKEIWKDATTYAASDQDRVPRVWELHFGNHRLVVHRIHGLEGWFFSCYSLGFKERSCGHEDQWKAMAEARQWTEAFIEALMSDFRKACRG